MTGEVSPKTYSPIVDEQNQAPSGDLGAARRRDGVRAFPLLGADLKRGEIIACAADLFDKHGYHTTNLEMIAKGVGLRKPTIYHYFKSKEEILASIHQAFIDLLIQKGEVRKEESSASDALAGVMMDILDLISTHRAYVRVFFEHHRELSAGTRRTIAEKRYQHKELLKGIIVRGIVAGEFRDQNPTLVTRAIYGMCNWAYQWYDPDGSMTSAEIAAEFFKLVFVGLQAD